MAVYYPTPMHVARAMLRVAGVTQEDTVYDLGCGDGRIVIAAAEEFGARGLGVELDPGLAKAAAAAVEHKGLGDRVQIQQGDARGLDASAASVITLYLNERANRQLLDSLKPGSLRCGTRVVSLFFPVQVRPSRGPESSGQQDTVVLGSSELMLMYTAAASSNSSVRRHAMCLACRLLGVLVCRASHGLSGWCGLTDPRT